MRVQELAKSRLGVLVSQYHFAFMYIYTTFKNQLIKIQEKKRIRDADPRSKLPVRILDRLSSLFSSSIQQTLLSHQRTHNVNLSHTIHIYIYIEILNVYK